MNGYFKRHQPATSPGKWLSAGLGGAIAIGLLGLMTTLSGELFWMAPFGASCVLLFAVPASPLSQPVNLVGGHLLATVVGLVLHVVLPDTWWAVALAVGLAIAGMVALRVTHPPAGADPLVVFFSDPQWGYLLFPVLLGSLLLVLSGTLYHRLSRTDYPLKRD